MVLTYLIATTEANTVVTSFEIARKDIDLLDSLAWSCVFVDEVHRVKNMSSKLTLALHQFTCVRRFGLTGTTIQNSYQEMWTILDWTNPGWLGTSRQWHRLIVKPLTIGQSTTATEEERAKAQVFSIYVFPEAVSQLRIIDGCSGSQEQASP